MKRTKSFLTLLFMVLALFLVVGCTTKKDPTVESIEVDSTTVPESILNTEVDSKLGTIKLKLIYSDDSVKTTDLKKSMISDEDYNKLSSEGTYTITITYEELTTTLSLTIKKSAVVKPEPTNPITYSVFIKDIAEKPLSNFYIQFYDGDDIVAEGYTKEDGMFEAELDPKKYEVMIEARDEYYLNVESFEVDSTKPNLEIISEINDLDGIEADPAEHRYEKGDVMYDFTITDIDGNVLRLYELLETKKAVVLNFWYTTCSACNTEFPYLLEAYEASYTNASGETLKYSDDIVVIAVNPGIAGYGDTASDVDNYRKSMGLTFNVAMDYDYDQSNSSIDPALHDMFNVNAYPTTVIIDQYGLIAELTVGAVVGTEKWTQEFDKYLAENYTPKYEAESESENGLKRPPEDLELPSSEAIIEAVAGTNNDNTKFDTTFTAGDAEYSWPWIIDNYDGKNVIKPSNSFENFSYSIMYFNLKMKEGDVFTFDYFSSCEVYDILYVTVDDTVVTEISGVNTEWEKCFAFVATEDGEYKFALYYLKDRSYSSGDDAVYLTNFRILTENDIDQETYVFRDCALGEINEITMSYDKYVTVVYNEEDGYYHVNSANGPLLLANLLEGSKWNNSSVYEVAYENGCIGYDGVDYNNLITVYSQYANNSTLGYTPVTKELANALKQVTKALGDEAALDNENQWLEVCLYYSAYGTNGEELGIPTVGVCPFEPIKFEGDGITEPAKAEAVFTKVILPRGMYFGFTAKKSGVYKFYSTVKDLETEGWICDKDGNVIADSDEYLRSFAKALSTGGSIDDNFIAYIYLEEGQSYVFVGAFYDLYEFNTLTVEVMYVTEKMELLTGASPAYFTTSDDAMTDIISGNFVEVKLGTDGYYHVIGSNATDDLVYCDIKYVNNITNTSLEDVLNIYNGFDFTKDEFGKPIFDENGYYLVTTSDENGNMISCYVCEDADGQQYYVKEIGIDGYTEENGYTYLKFTEEQIANMKNKDYKEYVTNYIKDNMITDENSELYGCVKVDEEFASVLDLLMGKYTFAGVEQSWLKLCYYYKYVGAVDTK